MTRYSERAFEKWKSFCPLVIVFLLISITVEGCFSYKLKQSVIEKNMALLPLDNLSDFIQAPVYVMPVLNGQLEQKGIALVHQNSINKLLVKERVRSTGYISYDIAREIEEEFNVKTVFVGSVTSFSDEGDLQFGLLARLINASDGSILWADYASASGKDYSKILGLGEPDDIYNLISRVVDGLLSSFGTIPPYKEMESTYRIAVMPFQNKSKFSDAGSLVSQMFLVELFKSRKFIPIEYGEVRRLIVDSRIRSKGALDYKNIKMLSGSLGIDGFLVGTVELYSDGRDTHSPPEVIITARLLDARKNRILWYNTSHFNGDDGIVVLDWGKIRTVDQVAYKAVSKLVKKMETTAWH
jgi:TolB-like protein